MKKDRQQEKEASSMMAVEVLQFCGAAESMDQAWQVGRISHPAAMLAPRQLNT